MSHLVITRAVDDDELAALRRPQDHFVREQAEGPDRFGIDLGPFTRWERRVEVDPVPGPDGRRRVTTTVDFTLALPVWAPAFVPFLRHNLRRTGGRGERTWWMPPLTDARSTGLIGVLATFAVIAGYLGVLLSQTNAFFKAEFGATSSEIADAQIAVRVGAFAALAAVALADRLGRRRVLVASCVAGIVLAATGAFVPNLVGITVSQGVARVFSTSMLLVAAVMATEDVPAHARASAQSILALAAGLGAGGVVLLLWVGGLAPWAWRLIYLVPLPLLAAVPALARHLPETRRFEMHALVERARRAAATLDRGTLRRRLLLVGTMLALFDLFVIPFGGFTNDYLINERGFSAVQITLFQVLTNVPGGTSILIGGRLADRWGRRRVGAVGLLGGTAASVTMFLTGGWVLWVASTVSVTLGGLLVPTVLVYPTEMFPTGSRSRAQGLTNLAAVAGTVTGLKVCGVLADRWGSFGPPMALLGAGPVLAAVLVLVWFPETCGVELEELNPGDQPPPEGDELAALDRRWEVRHEHGRHLAAHEHAGDDGDHTGADPVGGDAPAGGRP